ncbi:MAG: CbtB-domain containing protein, partial [Nitrospinaceae bacterium]|nr:CbtB-domain containing protein [Nitrospinaceae bacterium]
MTHTISTLKRFVLTEDVAHRIAPALAAGLLGAVLIFSAGFAQSRMPSIIHDAAHD